MNTFTVLCVYDMMLVLLKSNGKMLMEWLRASVAKSAVFPRNWATLTLFPRDVFHVSGLRRPNNVIFGPWNATFTRGTPPKNLYFTPRNIIFFTWGTPLKSNWATFGLVLSSNWAGFAEKTWQPCSEQFWRCSCVYVLIFRRQMLKSPRARFSLCVVNETARCGEQTDSVRFRIPLTNVKHW